MYICLIGLFLATFQVTCDGAPGRSFLALKRPANVSQEKKLVEKRALDVNACLAAHNAKRALHQNTEPLTWSDTLAQQAKAWADHLVETNTFQHDPNNTNAGENLYWSFSSTVGSCAQAVEGWYDEISDYDYNDPGFRSGTGHFTQVVWKATTQVGAALAKKVRSDGNIETYVVARYDPPGNYLGQFASNVMPTIN